MGKPKASIYFIRHAQSEFNAVFEQGGPDPMIFDARLSKLGIEQAAGLRHNIDDLMIERVITSPFIRTLQTASLIFGEGYPFDINPLVREQVSNSCDVGSSPGELKQAYPHLDFDHLDERWWHDGEKDHRGISVEPENLLQQRAESFIGELITNDNDQSVAIVSHGNFILATTGLVLKNCQIVRFDPIERSAHLVGNDD